MPHASPSSRMILGTVFPATRTPSTARSPMAICRWPTPLGSLPKISATRARSSGLVAAFGCPAA